MPRVLRDEQFHADEVGVVFVTQRCVRRAWLAGRDPLTGKDFSFRKEWIRRRLEALASVFAVDVLPPQKRGHSAFTVALVDLEVEARIQDRGLEPFSFAIEYHRMQCRGQGCAAEP